MLRNALLVSGIPKEVFDAIEEKEKDSSPIVYKKGHLKRKQ